MKKLHVAVLLALLIACMCCLSGCTRYVRTWQSNLWMVQAPINDTNPELGVLKHEPLIFHVICTRFRQVENWQNSMLAVTVSCRNAGTETYQLNANPIQVINAENALKHILTLDHVMYKLYGGHLRELAQVSRLGSPAPDYGDSLLGTILTSVTDAYRNYENAQIVFELHEKEALPYELYYKSFTPVSLPPGVATVWTDYFPLTTSEDTISIMLQGDDITNAIAFDKQLLTMPSKRDDGTGFIILLAFGLIFGMLMIVAEES